MEDQNGFADEIARRMHESRDRGDDFGVEKELANEVPGDEDRGDGSGVERELEDEDRSREFKWAQWLGDDWYGDIVYYLLRGKLRPGIRNINTRKRLRWIKLEAAKYVLIDNDENAQAPKLGYRESDGSLAQCIHSHQVEKVLHRFRDCHGHFSCGVMKRNLLGRYYWPGRFQDVVRWCSTCESCQRFGPLKNSTQVRSIYSLQPMDLLGMDFLGPITPNSLSGSVYILIVVDYFSRYLFAHATKKNTGEAVVEFLERISKIFGWPLAFYVDNGSHFVKGKVRELVTRLSIKLFTAPVTNPRSVGLSERYVQLVLAGLRVMVEADKRTDAMQWWDEHLDGVVQAVNTRVLRVHGYSPSQLFLGFNVRLHELDLTIVERMRQALIQEMIHDDVPEHIQYKLRLAQIEELRELTRERVLQDQEEREARAAIPRFSAPQVGDLVLRCHFQVDKSLGMKLHTKWEGPYELVRVSKSGVSGDLKDLKSDLVIGRYAFES